MAVYSERGVQLGYLTAERCGMIGARMAAGREVRAIFQRPARFGAVIRAAFDGEVPTLPPETDGVEQVPAGEQDFWPDPEWPDE